MCTANWVLNFRPRVPLNSLKACLSHYLVEIPASMNRPMSAFYCFFALTGTGHLFCEFPLEFLHFLYLFPSTTRVPSNDNFENEHEQICWFSLSLLHHRCHGLKGLWFEIDWVGQMCIFLFMQFRRVLCSKWHKYVSLKKSAFLKGALVSCHN